MELIWTMAKAGRSDLFIISSFISATQGMKEQIRKDEKFHPDGKLSEYGREWMNSHIGTVNTFQGKEEAEYCIDTEEFIPASNESGSHTCMDIW